jgi:hypothetical protein
MLYLWTAVESNIRGGSGSPKYNFHIFPTTKDKFDDSNLNCARLPVISILLLILILYLSKLYNRTYYH